MTQDQSHPNPHPSPTFSTYQRTFPGLKNYKATGKPPYYNERFGIWLKPVLDQVIATGEDQRIDSKKLGISKASLRTRIHQAWAWLINNRDDKEGTYRRLREIIQVRTEGSWISLRHKIYHKPMAILQASDSIGRVQKLDQWRETLTEFIEAAKENEYYEEPSLVLTDGDIEFIKIICAAVGDIAILNLSRRGFKVIRNKELFKEMEKEK